MRSKVNNKKHIIAVVIIVLLLILVIIKILFSLIYKIDKNIFASYNCSNLSTITIPENNLNDIPTIKYNDLIMGDFVSNMVSKSSGKDKIIYYANDNNHAISLEKNISILDRIRVLIKNNEFYGISENNYIDFLAKYNIKTDEDLYNELNNFLCQGKGNKYYTPISIMKERKLQEYIYLTLLGSPVTNYSKLINKDGYAINYDKNITYVLRNNTDYYYITFYNTDYYNIDKQQQIISTIRFRGDNNEL